MDQLSVTQPIVTGRLFQSRVRNLVMQVNPNRPVFLRVRLTLCVTDLLDAGWVRGSA